MFLLATESTEKHGKIVMGVHCCPINFIRHAVKQRIRSAFVETAVVVDMKCQSRAFLLPQGEGQDEGIGNIKALASFDPLTPTLSCPLGVYALWVLPAREGAYGTAMKKSLMGVGSFRVFPWIPWPSYSASSAGIDDTGGVNLK